jgi:hypothetical protein
MRPTDPAISIAQNYRALSLPQGFLGIVSPCSTCTNQRALPAADGRPACPRRVAAARKIELDSLQLDSSQYTSVILTGMNGVADDGTKPLSNPVYDAPSNLIQIWVATLKDNAELVNKDGSVASPDLLDPAFTTDWIQCRPLPFGPRDTEAQYFQKGCLQEGDQLEIQVSPTQQVLASTTAGSNVMLDGTVHKVNHHSLFPRVPVNQDLCVSGL